jgi:RNA polymerase sigma-70 factor, ECF subfamily
MGRGALAEMGNLAERILRGDPAAETELVQQFSQRIFVMSVVRTRDREVARDLVQDVLLAVITSLRKGLLHDPDKLDAYVHGTARNVIYNHLRDEAQNLETEILPDDLPQVISPHDIAEAERLRLVEDALERLRRQDREILQMTLVEGKKPAEIAAQLGLTSEVVRTRKLRASRKIAQWVTKKLSRTQKKRY